MPAEDEKNGTGDCLELNCTAHQLTDASIRSSGHGSAVFSFYCESFTEAELASLEQAARSHRGVRLIFRDFTARLLHVHVQRLDAGQVHVAGEVIPLIDD